MSSYKNMRPTCSGGNEGKQEEGIAGGWRVGAGVVDTAQSSWVFRGPSWYHTSDQTSSCTVWSGESPHVLCKCPLRTKTNSSHALLGTSEARNLGTRKALILLLFLPNRSQDSNVEKISHKESAFLKVSVDRQIK